jgi:hypothetical protein
MDRPKKAIMPGVVKPKKENTLEQRTAELEK